MHNKQGFAYMQRLLFLFCIIALATAACRRPYAGCTEPNASNYDPGARADNGSCYYDLSPEQYAQIATAVRSNVTGVSFGGAVTVPHIITNPLLVNPDSTYRDILANRASLQGELPVGTVIVKRIFLKNPDGTRGSRANVYAMVKQYAGYYPRGGNWQYIAIPYNPSIVNDAQPNGLLSGAALNGKVQICADCHASAPQGRFVFTPD